MTGSVGAETLVSDAWMALALADVTLAGLISGVHEHPAPLDALYPFVTWQTWGPAADVTGIGPDARIMVNANYLVRATAEYESFQSFKAIVRRIDFLLDGATHTSADGHVFACQRTEEFRLEEPLNGGTVRHLGGIYRVQVQSI